MEVNKFIAALKNSLTKLGTGRGEFYICNTACTIQEGREEEYLLDKREFSKKLLTYKVPKRFKGDFWVEQEHAGDAYWSHARAAGEEARKEIVKLKKGYIKWVIEQEEMLLNQSPWDMA